MRDNYASLCQALRDEYSVDRDLAAAFLNASQIMHDMSEPPRNYYFRLRKAYFEQCYVPESEDDDVLKSLFLRNLHDMIRYDVTLHCRAENLSMTESRRYAQLVWEMRVRPVLKGGGDKANVLNIQMRSRRKRRSNSSLPHNKGGTLQQPEWKPPEKQKPSDYVKHKDYIDKGSDYSEEVSTTQDLDVIYQCLVKTLTLLTDRNSELFHSEVKPV